MVSKKTVRLAQLSILTALIVVLQLLSYSIKIGPFGLSLVLIPIVVGGALFGVRSGAILGGVFGVVVVLCCVFGLDVGGNMLWSINPLLTALICVGKGVAAGAAGAAVSAVFKKMGKPTVGVFLSAIIVPVVNTGLFLAMLSLCFYDTLVLWAAGQNVAYYVLTGIILVNFVPELLLNTILAPVAQRVIATVRRNRM
ncbi:MAG: ECF transporter S component [Clostridia bacterium]|nr:ECF transporter S component [Clostridia bacterium]